MITNFHFLLFIFAMHTISLHIRADIAVKLLNFISFFSCALCSVFVAVKKKFFIREERFVFSPLSRVTLGIVMLWLHLQNY